MLHPFDCTWSEFVAFLDGPLETVLQLPARQERRKRIALALLDRFSKVFPLIIYDLFWESRSINAQAWQIGSEKHVSIYGGLVRHARMHWAALALALAHETGHHLGGLPRDPDRKWITWQGQADYWAAYVAMPQVFGGRAKSITLKGAREFLRFHEIVDELLLGDEPDLSAQCRYEIFCAAANGLAIPICAKQEFEQSFGVNYPNT
jgi:hypothetical protein